MSLDIEGDGSHERTEAELEVLFAVSTLQPIRLPDLARTLRRERREVERAVIQLRSEQLIHGNLSGPLFATNGGRLAVDRAGSGLRNARDIGRLLYLWRGQRGSGQ